MIGNNYTTEKSVTMENNESVTQANSTIRTFENYTREQCCHLYDENGLFIKPVTETETKVPFQNTDNRQKIEQIMKKLEDEGTQIAVSTLKDTTSTQTEVAAKLIGFMSDGANRFKKEAGRQMTYSEMRETWG